MKTITKYITVNPRYRRETESFMDVGQGPNWGCSAKEKKTLANPGTINPDARIMWIEI
jgi:hypothetical protein